MRENRQAQIKELVDAGLTKESVLIIRSIFVRPFVPPPNLRERAMLLAFDLTPKHLDYHLLTNFVWQLYLDDTTPPRAQLHQFLKGHCINVQLSDEC